MSAAQKLARSWPKSAANPGFGKRKVTQAAITDMAAEMLDVQASGRGETGFAFAADTHWQRSSRRVSLRETDDQLHAIADIKEDMQTRGRWTG